MRWSLIIEEFGTNIQHISGVDSIVSDTLSRLPSTPSDKNEPCTRKTQCCANELFAIGREGNNYIFLPQNLLIVQKEQPKELRNINSILSTYISDQVSGYSKQELDDVKIICYDSKIYVLLSLRKRALDWYHFYLNRPSGSRLSKTVREVCYWKGLVTQEELFAKMCKTRQQLKKRKTLYGHLPSKNIAEIKPWNTVHVDLIGPYSKSIRQQQPGGTIIQKNAILTCMMIINPATALL